MEAIPLKLIKKGEQVRTEGEVSSAGAPHTHIEFMKGFFGVNSDSETTFSILRPWAVRNYAGYATPNSLLESINSSKIEDIKENDMKIGGVSADPYPIIEILFNKY